MDEIQARHRKELKDLQGRITQKKKNATKKTRKGVNDECERLERELKERHQAETDALGDIQPEKQSGELHVSDSSIVVSDDTPVISEKKVSFSPSIIDTKDEPEEQHRPKKPNRQKARLARRAAEQEQQAAAASEEAANQPDLREQEMKSMDHHKKRLGLTETFIRPDGHCLFSACAHGLPTEVIKSSGPHTEAYQNVRFATGNFMSGHRDDFEAFLEEPFESYVEKIKNSAEWGGQLELQAIAKTYDVTVNVLQASGRIEKFEPSQGGSESKNVWLAYYKHSFGLGEHYNALTKV